MKIIAGIDGGGTGTIVELRSMENKVLERDKFGPFNINSIGEEKLYDLLREIFEYILQSGECEGICIGAAGISNSAVDDVLKEITQELGFSGKMILKGDHDIALYGAMSGAPGSVLIAGTGSICTGMDAEGKTARAGGWGHLIDDTGSGYALGRDALGAVVRSLDGRSKATLLSSLIYDFWGISNERQLIEKVYSTSEKSNIASLSPVVEKAALQGDKTACTIMEKNAGELVELVACIYRKLKLESMKLSLLGSLISKNTLLREDFLKQLAEKLPAVQVKEPDMDAASGAALWAWQLVQGK
ncbi:MAG: hypothetical protein NC548_57645 [Lachnospiraceae bacterium]|nr:hypothetical protein [Lachnospiraceae bacterium]